MEKVGGYESLLLLEEDANAYEDVLLWMRAEAQAHRETQRRNRRKPGQAA